MHLHGGLVGPRDERVGALDRRYHVELEKLQFRGEVVLQGLQLGGEVAEEATLEDEEVAIERGVGLGGELDELLDLRAQRGLVRLVRRVGELALADLDSDDDYADQLGGARRVVSAGALIGHLLLLVGGVLLQLDKFVGERRRVGA